MSEQLAHIKITRSRDRRIGGVCAGIAEYYDFDPITIRVLAILLTISTFGLAALVYILLWVYVPLAAESSAPYEVKPERAESTAYGEIDFSLASDYDGLNVEDELSDRAILSRLAIAVGLMLLFLIGAIASAPIVPGAHVWQFWPLALLIVGIGLIVVPIRSKRFGTTWHALGIIAASAGAMMFPMSLGVVAWETIPNAFSNLWVFFAVAAVLYIVGMIRDSRILVFVSALCIAAFCFVGLLWYALPGAVGSITVFMPDGSTIRFGV